MQHHHNESGFALVTTMLILLTLTFIGIGSTRNSITELKISGNDRIAKELLYEAESAAMEAAGRMQNENDPDELIAKRSSKLWLLEKENDGTDPVSGDTNVVKWQDQNFTGKDVAGIPVADAIVQLAVVDHGVVKGSGGGSLKVTGTSVHGYHVFGYAEKQNGFKLIEIGYRKEF
ncbi:MAG: hypothetical protein Kow0089_02640 [Desulfobulbaceae bacterium]